MGYNSRTTGTITYSEIRDESIIPQIKYFLEEESGLAKEIGVRKDDPLMSYHANVSSTEIRIESESSKAYYLKQELQATVDFLRTLGVEVKNLDVMRQGENREDEEHYKLVRGKVVSSTAKIIKTFEEYK